MVAYKSFWICITGKLFNSNKIMTLKQYINKINIILEAKCGMGVADLADYNFADAYEDGESASSVAKQMLENEGFTM